jgi:two-component sensor histidine kinase
MATDKLRAFARFALTSPPRSLIGDFGLAALFFLSAVLTEVVIGFSFANAPPYITFFPLLVLTTLLCSLSASIAYIVASAIAGSFWIATQPARIEAIVLYSLAAALIVALTDGLKDAYRQIQARDEQLMVLNAELAHRIRNLLQIANALVGQSIDSGANPKDLKATLTGRLNALSAAQSFLTLPPGSVSLSKVVDVTLAPARDRLIVNGPRVLLPTKVITMLSLVLYELGTNALKYGAWSAPKGVVSIGWLARAGTVTVEWKEHDGPPIKTPHKLGAGTKLIRTAIPDAVVDYRLERNGARCKIELPLGQKISKA